MKNSVPFMAFIAILFSFQSKAQSIAWTNVTNAIGIKYR